MGFLRDSIINTIQKNRESGTSIILKMIGLDGGPGSGNFNHAGNPPNVGGSGAGGGSGLSGSKEVNVQKSGVEYADNLKKKYDRMPKEVNPFTLTSEDIKAGKGVSKNNLMYNFFRMGSDTENMSEKDMDKIYYHYLDVVKKNGNPEKTNKKVVYTQHKLTEERLLDGVPGKKAKEYTNELNLYMGDNWEKANNDVLEDFIKDCPIVFQDSISRGIHVNKDVAEKLLEEINSGVVSFGRVTSWSSDYATASAFASNDDNNKTISDDEVSFVFYIPSKNSRTAVPVAPFGSYKENECLMSGKSSYSVVYVKEHDFLSGHNDKPFSHGYMVCLIERGEEYE